MVHGESEQPFFRSNFCLLCYFFPLGVTGDYELKLLIKITKLKEKYKKTNSILKKRRCPLSDSGSDSSSLPSVRRHPRWRLSGGLIVQSLEKRSGILRSGSHEISTPDKMPGPVAKFYIIHVLFSFFKFREQSYSDFTFILLKH